MSDHTQRFVASSAPPAPTTPRGALLLAFSCLAWLSCSSSSDTPGSGSPPASGGGGSGGAAPSGSGGSGGSSPTPGSGGSGGGNVGGSGGRPADAGGSRDGGDGRAASPADGGRDAGGRADASAGGDAGRAGDTPAAPPAAGGCAGVTGARFCADFDDQTAGQAPTGPFTLVKENSGTQAGSMLVDSSKFFSGRNSFHIHMTNVAGDTKAQLAFVAPLLPVPSNDVNGRAMIFLMRDPPNHWDLVTAFGTAQPQDNDNLIQYTLGSMAGHLMPVYQPGDDSVDSRTQTPVGRWACIQWQFRGAADGTHALRVKLDGQLIEQGDITRGGPGNPNWAATTWRSMKFGFITFGNAGNVDMWIDDLAFGEREIPCPAR